MELKVWVDGIKRVVCGVTDNTTCQDIVIALAQAMGRTGRFTLIEKWRENERPLAPTECPLLVLQKWGEFASEVKLMLYESGTRRKQKQSEKESVQKPPDRFSHNFTPPVKTSEAVIRRSLTFSGGMKQELGVYKRPEGINFQRQSNQGPQGPVGNQRQSRLLQVPEKVTSDGNSWSSSSSLSSQSSAPALQQQQQRRRRSSSHDRMTSHDRQRPSPSLQSNQTVQYGGYGQQNSNQVQQFTNKVPQFSNQGPQFHQSTNQRPASHNSIPVNNSSIPHNFTQQTHTHSGNSQPKYNNNVPMTNGPVKPVSRPIANGPIHSSAFSPVQPRKNNFEGKSESPRISNMDIPIYTDHRKSSHKHEMEEYDLDSNFPDVVKETGQDRLIEEFRMPGGPSQSQHRNLMSREEEERVKLLRLVTMQNERIKMQDSQLEIIDTEISSREQKHEDLKLEINHVTEELTKLSELSKQKDDEIHKLDNGTLIDEMELEKQAEREIKNEITALRSRLEKCEKDLQQFQSKVQVCSKDLEHEQEVLKTDEKRRREEEVKLEAEISELRKEVDERSKELDEKTKIYDSVENELKSVTEQLNKKTEDLTSTEKELQRENLKFFQHPQSTDKSTGSNSNKTEGEAVLKVLEGSVTPKLKRNRITASPLTILEMTKKETGVWV
ncbi:mRNA export factor GLE1-like isoform X1 [Mercenaria mercenaria]|uniref:mRNA export factor GLE1-like isoform X1 n=1 Tax=Mercenaria mercenaria TaxID=6596 RepID=UPI00234F84D1|nr:mRNA export factor GLE1-like isoform X1 [Mercenaria mercenaria]XP_053383538.1 mRNA export factor GLE1-like isoform X1 [Mercenaria mercenaria]XP_053383539.1 mRNA export factor GLE1-like isoform X1 [Mercenaria mercenaria]XP_053383540.1 mRNA export factor GLE1-like isoform X1 [Mercenaria mercenaria]XP_053383541.1 mRNA export factor GLE1-like isoform X1 [Mercenaria mercenaria]XP_053383542.1 mRNA export factor GLE1-like isoform X1 [Mercenaria mercenaria]